MQNINKLIKDHIHFLAKIKNQKPKTFLILMLFIINLKKTQISLLKWKI